jgi:hypothetical protein
MHVQESQGFPRVERDVVQVEQFSEKLRAKAARVNATSEALDASRLLAQEGLNPRRRAAAPLYAAFWRGALLYTCMQQHWSCHRSSLTASQGIPRMQGTGCNCQVVITCSGPPGCLAPVHGSRWLERA